MADFNQHNLVISHDHVLGTTESASTIGSKFMICKESY